MTGRDSFGGNEKDNSIIEKLLSSDVKLDLLTLFHSNPGLIDKPDAVARRVGRTAAEIGDGLSDLIELGVLIRKKLGKSEIILFDRSRDSEIQRVISNRLLGGNKQ
jgi:hypothetical protein